MLMRVVVGFLLLCTVAMVPVWGSQDISMCASAIGFAGLQNYKFTITPNESPRQGESIVLAIRSVPQAQGGEWVQAIINATFTIGGTPIYMQSGDDGTLQILDAIPRGTVIHAQILNKRGDGEYTPFQFFSYMSNYRACFIRVTAKQAFTGPLVGHVSNSDVIAKAYFVSERPGNAKSFQLDVTGFTGMLKYSDSDKIDGLQVDSSTPVNFQGDRLYLYAFPSVDATQMVHIGINWLTDPGAVPPPGPQPSGQVNPPQPVGSSPPSSEVKTAEAAGGGAVGIIVMILLGYFFFRSIYNYKVKDITEFPEFIPHYEIFIACGRFCGGLAEHVKSRGRGGRGQSMAAGGGGGGSGYSNVDQDEHEFS